MVTLSQLSSFTWGNYGLIMSVFSFIFALSFLFRKRKELPLLNRFLAFLVIFFLSLIIFSYTIAFFYDDIGNQKMFDFYGNVALFFGVGLILMFPTIIILKKMNKI